MRISYKFLISDCRGDSDLGLRTVVLGTLHNEFCSAVGGSVLSRVFATILSRSEHCTAAFFAQGAKHYIDVKLDLLYRLIL